MEIEIITTKKKLTKSIINQMRFPTDAVVKYSEPLGYMINVLAKTHKAILIKSIDGEYFVIPASYQKGETSVYRKIGKWSQSKKFESIELCDQWWVGYLRLLKLATTQIYI